MSVKTITIYHALYDTGELADGNIIGVETEHNLFSGELNRSKYEITVRASLPGNLYPLYAIHCGEVKYFNANTHRTGLTISGTIYNNEIDNTWIVVYAEVSQYEARKAKIFTENEDARLFLSNSLIDFEKNGSYLEQSDNFDFYDISINTGAMSDEFFTYGSTYSPTCSIEMMPTDKVTQGNWIRIEFKVYGVWQNFGVFYIKEPPENTSEYILVEGIGMLEYIGSTFIPVTHIISIKKAVEYLWETFGVPLTFDFDVYDSSLANYYNNSSVVLPSEAIEKTNTDSNTGAEWSSWVFEMGSDDLRSVLSKMSLGLYSNVVERNGFLIVTHNDWRDYKETELFTDDNCVSEPIQKLDAYYSPDRVKIICEKMAWNKNWDLASYVVGAEAGVQFLNDKVQDDTKNIIYYPLGIYTENGGYCEVQPLAPQQWGNQNFAKYDLNSLAGELGLKIPFYYYPIDTEINGYSPFIYAGSCIQLEINGVVRNIYVGNLNLSWSGGMFSMSISTPGDIDIQGVDASSSSTSSGGVSSSSSGSVSIGLATSIQNATIFNDGVIEGRKIAESTIQNSNIADSTIEGSKIKDSTITGGKIANATIENSNIKDGTIDGSKLTNSIFSNGKIQGSAIDGSTFTKGTINGSAINGSTFEKGQISGTAINTSTFENGSISGSKIDASKFSDGVISGTAIDTSTFTNGSISGSVIDSSTLTNIPYASIDDAFVNNLKTQALDAAYANIDFSNVKTQVVGTEIIKDSAITDAKISDLSANKITAGTFDASKATIINLNASSINTGELIVGGVKLNITDNTAEIDGSDIKDGTITLSGLSQDVKDIIDGAIETFTTDSIPTLNNYPTSSWQEKDYDRHVGDIVYVINPASQADGFSYRFAKDSNGTYSWVLIKDSDVTKALQELITVQGDISGLKAFESTTTSWISNTDEELSSLKGRTTALETDIGTKVDSNVFNEVKQTVDNNTASITGLSTTVSKKADNSTVSALAQRTSNVEQDLSGFKTTVSETYTTINDFNALEIGVRNIITNSETLDSSEHMTFSFGLSYKGSRLTYKNNQLVG